MLIYQNVRGLNTKLSDLYLNSFSCNFSVIVFTESWLKPTTCDLEVFCSNYNVYRKDRLLRKGGGVLVAVHSSIPSSLVSISGIFVTECLCVRLTFCGVNVFIICSYIPPNSDVEVYLEHARIIGEVMELMSLRDIIFICGDFNIPDVSWHHCSERGFMVPSSCNRLNNFFDILSGFGLMQLNNVFNVSNRLLDLVYSNVSDLALHRTLPFVLPEDKYHPTLRVNIDLAFNDSLIDSTGQVNHFFNFKRANFISLRNSLLDVIWPSFSGEFCVDFDKFYDMLRSNFRSSVPIASGKINSLSPPWFTGELRGLKNRRNRLYKKFKVSGSCVDYMNYSIAMHKCDTLNRKCYADYLRKIKAKLKLDPKCFYQFVNSKRKVRGYPSSLEYEGVLKSTDIEIADLFAKFFQSTYLKCASSSSEYPYSIQRFDVMFDFSLSYNDVYMGLLSLKPTYSPGPDGVPSIVLRECADALYIPLTKMFNLSLSKGVFPPLWRESFIIPLHKSGSRSNMENYRGIAKLSAIPKLFEKLITCKLIHSLRGIISPHQHGFLKGKSTVTNLLEFISFIFSSFQSKLQTDVIYTDFSKAFDRVDHRLLLLKLDLIGFPCGLLHWLSSYLLDRTQAVLFKGCVSRRIFVTSGVPQGSHLGPVLFNLFLNDLPLVIRNSKLLMYADDVKLFRSLETVGDSHLLQDDLVRLADWCRCNNMLLNLRKCKQMSFNRNNFLLTSYLIDNYILENVSSFGDLGIIFDPKLTFNLHIDSCVSRASSLLGFIKRWSREFDDPYIAKRLYTSLVRPILEYGSLVWSPNYRCHIDRIESVQKQFLLFALRNLGWRSDTVLPSYINRLALIDLPTLEHRRIMLGICFMAKLINGEINSPHLISNIYFNVPIRASRHFVPLKLPAVKHNYEAFNPLYSLCKHFNQFYHLFSISDSVEVIKRKILSNNVH